MLKITWLGQGGFVLEDNKIQLLIDPYLSNSLEKAGFDRIYPPPVELSSLKPDLICCTHDHGDHFDSETILPLFQQSPNCLLLGPESVINHAENLSITRSIKVQPSQKFQFKSFTIKAVPAFHSDSHAVGFLIEWNNVNLYFSGDTLNSANLVPEILRISAGKIDIVFICINGKYNNMDTHNAVKVIELLFPKVGIPMHYDLFANNSANPDPFIEAIEQLGVKGVILKQGEANVLTQLLP